MSIGFDLEEAVETTLKRKTMPMWNVIIHNTDTHSFPFVIELLMKIFNKSYDDAVVLTMKVHTEELAIVDTTTKERAELKRQQVHDYGPDPNMKVSKTPIPCTIEPVKDE